MNTNELELKLKEILKEQNFFDMILKAKEFEKEYKQSDFYKKTKMPVMDVIKYSKIWYAFNLDMITDKIQQLINNLDLDKINALITEFAGSLELENEETMDLLEKIQNLDKN